MELIVVTVSETSPEGRSVDTVTIGRRVWRIDLKDTFPVPNLVRANPTVRGIQ
jgi:hypothetical protein